MSERAVNGAGDTLLDLPHGNGMQPPDTAHIMSRSLTSVVLFAGTSECGKTTLLAALHLLFQSGPFAGYNFAGSDCWSARATLHRVMQ